MKDIIQSTNPDVDTLKCPKCGCIWRSLGYYDYDEGGWSHGTEDFCPNHCRTKILGLPITGRVVPRHV